MKKVEQKKQSNRIKILKMLKRGPVNYLMARELEVYDLAKQIMKIKQAGVHIVTKTYFDPDTKVNYAEYSLLKK